MSIWPTATAYRAMTWPGRRSAERRGRARDQSAQQ